MLMIRLGLFGWRFALDLEPDAAEEIIVLSEPELEFGFCAPPEEDD